jgi:RNA polymerase sigma-70 factor (ECF subfamily)
MRFLARQPGLDRETPPDGDARLVLWAQQDPQAFKALYDRYFPSVFGYCLSQLGDRQAAEDATSQTFLKALAALPQYQESGRFRAWLFTIAHNAVLTLITSQRPAIPFEDAVDTADRDRSPEDSVIAALDRAWLDEAIARLPDDDRRVMELRRAGLRGRDIADILGISHEAAKKRQLRAMDRLRTDMTAAQENSEVRYGA